MSRKHKEVRLIGAANIKCTFVMLVALPDDLKHNGACFLTYLLCL